MLCKKSEWYTVRRSTLRIPTICSFFKLAAYSQPGAHLGGEEGDTSPAFKRKSVLEEAICPENAS